MQDVKRTDTPSQQMSLSVAIRTSAAASETNRAVICQQVNLTVCPLFGTEVGGMKAALFSLGSFQQHVIIGNYFVFSLDHIWPHPSLSYLFLSIILCRVPEGYTHSKHTVGYSRTGCQSVTGLLCIL